MLAACGGDRANGVAAEATVVSTPTLAPLPTATPSPTPQPTPSPEPPEPTPAPQPIVLPRDEGPHEVPREWWYYSGHLADEEGRQFGFHFVVFKVWEPGFPQVFLGQIGITEVGIDQHVSGGFINLRTQQAGSGELSVAGRDWMLGIANGIHHLEGEVAGMRLSASLTPTKAAVLHNGDGWLADSQVSGWTYYYSWSRMDAEATLEREDGSIRLTGTAWMDHQWGDFDVPDPPAGWQWFAVQLDDGRDLMLTEIRDSDGVETARFGTLVGADGEVTALTDADVIEVEVLSTWTSPKTDGQYPAEWRLTVDSLGLDPQVRSAVADQEIVSFLQPLPVYWEGDAEVSGTFGGVEVSGRAYVELVGYAR